jgi:hypothetical protein
MDPSYFPSAPLGGAPTPLTLPGQGRWVALATVSVCMVGALGVALRPILRKSFAGAAAVQSASARAARAAAGAAGRTDPQVQALLARIRELEARRVARNPMRAGLGGPGGD